MTVPLPLGAEVQTNSHLIVREGHGCKEEREAAHCAFVHALGQAAHRTSTGQQRQPRETLRMLQEPLSALPGCASSPRKSRCAQPHLQVMRPPLQCHTSPGVTVLGSFLAP